MATSRYIDEVMRPAIARGAEQAGRADTAVAVADWVIVAVSDDADQAREDAKRQIAFHATVRTYDGILDLHGFETVAARIRELWKSFDLAGMTALVTDEMLDEMAVAGTVQDCRAALERRAASADRLLLGAPVVATDPARIRDYHDAIVETFATAPD
jgi:alkanesulfonate monooxygenase SsuD/methylene tetrahydromethanopterin reductase-like flavin-dependent oxidoreductase (luciferase family)